MARLECRYGRMKGMAYELESETLIGRARTGAIVLAHRLISNRHARIYKDPERGCYMVEDLGSLNGTLLDGSLITEPEPLDHLHMINFGGASDFFFVDPQRVPTGVGERAQLDVPDAPEEPKPNQTHMGQLPVATPSFLASRKPAGSHTIAGSLPAALPQNLARPVEKPKPKEQIYLVLTNLKKPWAVPLVEGVNVLGRTPGLQLRLDNEDISRQHAILTLEEGKVYLEDMNSTNHTYYRGKTLTKKVEVKLGEAVGFGRVKGKLEKRSG